MLLLSMILSLAHAEDKKDEAPVVTVGGMVFAHYGYILGPDAPGDIATPGTAGFNEFALDRSYLTAQATINPALGVRLTLDGDHLSNADADPKYRIFVKHAYLEWRLPVNGVKARFGITDTPYAPYQDNFIGLRWIGKSAGDANKFVSTADVGASIQGDQAKGLVSWQLGVYNGQGYANPEIDAGKALQARVSIDPLAPREKFSLPITGYLGYAGNPSVGEDATLTYAGALGFKMPHLVFWGDYMGEATGEKSRSTWSVSAVPKAPRYGELILRYSAYDPDADTENDGTSTLVAGIGHDFADKVSAAVTYEETFYEAKGVDPMNGIFLRMQAGF